MKKTQFFPSFIPIFSFLLLIACSSGSNSSSLVDVPSLGNVGANHLDGDHQGDQDPHMGPVERPAMSVDSDPTTGCQCNSTDPIPDICQPICANLHSAPGVVNLGAPGTGGHIYQVQGQGTTGQILNSEPAVPVINLPPEFDKSTGLKVDYTQSIHLMILQQATQSDTNTDSDSNSDSTSTHNGDNP